MTQTPRIDQIERIIDSTEQDVLQLAEGMEALKRVVLAAAAVVEASRTNPEVPLGAHPAVQALGDEVQTMLELSHVFEAGQRLGANELTAMRGARSI